MYLVYLVIILVLLIIQCFIYKLDANDKYKFLPYTWQEMEKAYKYGIVKALGVSNFPISLLHELLNCYQIAKPIVNQIESHPYLPQVMMSQYAKVNGITLQGEY